MRPEKSERTSRVALVAAALAITLGALFFQPLRRIMTQPQQPPGTVTAILNGQLTLPLAPENISTIPLYHVHKNLWDTLVSEGGSPGLARLLSVEGGGTMFHFELRPEVRFSNGRKVTSADIVFSLRRLMDKLPGGHFNAKSAIRDIQVLNESQFDIILTEPTASFLFLLSTPELGIVPKESCDSAGNVRHLGITSGPYTVGGDPETGHIELLKNPHFLRHEARSPDRLVLLFPGTAEAMVKAAEQEHADLVEAYDTVGIEALQKLKSNPEFKENVTKPSLSLFLVSGSARLRQSEKLALAGLFREKFEHYFHLNPELERSSTQLLPPGTFGSLASSPEQHITFAAANLPKKLRFAAMNPNMALAKAIVSLMREAHIEVEVSKLEGDLSQVDVALRGQGMNSDYPEIELYLALVSEWATIPATDSEKARVMQALHSEDMGARQKLIQDLGSDLLRDGRVIPLFVRSYAHLYRHGRINVGGMVNYDGDLPFWRIKVMGE